MSLAIGSRGQQVRDLQTRLRAQGLYRDSVDGIYGPNTRRAVAQFQSRNNLQQTGRADASTFQRLQAARNRDSFETAPAGPAARRRRADTGGVADVATGPASSVQQRLAAEAQRTARRMNSTGRCAKAVNDTIGAVTGQRTWGHANQLPSALRQRGFRQVNRSLEQALRTPGLVLTWDRTSTRLGRIYGHTAITLGDGRRSASDFIERDTLASSRGRTGLRVWMPPGT